MSFFDLVYICMGLAFQPTLFAKASNNLAYSVQRLETTPEVMIGLPLVQLNICTCKHCS